MTPDARPKPAYVADLLPRDDRTLPDPAWPGSITGGSQGTSSPARGRAALSCQQVITDIEGRIRLLAALADALAEHGKQPDTVLQACECILGLRQQLVKLRGSRGGEPEMLPARRVNAAEAGLGREGRPTGLAG